MQAPLVPGIHFETAPSHDREVTCPFASSVPNHTCSVFCILSPDATFLPPIRPSTRRFLKLPSSSHGTDVRLAIYQDRAEAEAAISTRLLDEALPHPPPKQETQAHKDIFDGEQKKNVAGFLPREASLLPAEGGCSGQFTRTRDTHPVFFVSHKRMECRTFVCSHVFSKFCTYAANVREGILGILEVLRTFPFLSSLF